MAVTRLLAVGALAGSETAWRKLVNAVALDVYKVDHAIQIGGLGVDGEPAARWREIAAERLADSRVMFTEVLADARCAPFGAALPLVHVGSGDLRAVVARDAPKLAICGGAPDSAPRKTWLADTLCLDPGSAARQDAICGWVVDLSPHGVMVASRLSM